MSHYIATSAQTSQIRASWIGHAPSSDQPSRKLSAMAAAAAAKKELNCSSSCSQAAQDAAKITNSIHSWPRTFVATRRNKVWPDIFGALQSQMPSRLLLIGANYL